MFRPSICSRPLTKEPTRCVQWHPAALRCYTSGRQADPEWFQALRQQMLNRKPTVLRDKLNLGTERKIQRTLQDFVPGIGKHSPSHHTRLVPFGHHLAYFNAAVPAEELLPDGTDSVHSPGEPYSQRMWAGGSLKLHSSQYNDPSEGWAHDQLCVCVEHIKDVQLRGQDDNAKIFVTIERQFSSIARLMLDGVGASSKAIAPVLTQRPSRMEQGPVLFVEERNLVFMKDRSSEDTQKLAMNDTGPTKYIKPPEDPEFSHTLTPTRSLLFRFSALTFNAHSIHLDRDYCRNVAGHRDLLVHGPLTLMLLLKVTHAHLKSTTEPIHGTVSIEYRNLAPLYCDEQLRVCGKFRKAVGADNYIYDVWIEGPSGGMAVKGVVHTAPKFGPMETARDEESRQPATSFSLSPFKLPPTSQSNQTLNVRRVMAPPRRMEVKISPHTRALARRIFGTRVSEAPKKEPVPLVRTYYTTKEHRKMRRKAAVRRISAAVKVRKMGVQSLKQMAIEARWSPRRRSR